MKKSELLYLDLETTGVDDHDHLVQVAYKYDNAESFVRYFKPPIEISLIAMSVCHITNTMVADKEKFQGSDMCDFLKAELEGGPSIMVAHNAAFDMKFLKKEGIVPQKYICTMKLIHDFDKKCELEKHNLQYLRYYFRLSGLENVKPHDALSDVLVLEALFNQVFVKHYTLEEMVEISLKPIIYRKMMFGKHKGKFFEDIVREDCNYLLWLRRDGENLGDDLKATLDFYINRRTQV